MNWLAWAWLHYLYTFRHLGNWVCRQNLCRGALNPRPFVGLDSCRLSRSLKAGALSPKGGAGGEGKGARILSGPGPSGTSPASVPRSPQWGRALTRFSFSCIAVFSLSPLLLRIKCCLFFPCSSRFISGKNVCSRHCDRPTWVMICWMWGLSVSVRFSVSHRAKRQC